MRNSIGAESYSSAMGYGFWCGKRCAQAKIDAGIPPLGAKKANKAQEAENDRMLAQAALEKIRKKKKEKWSPKAVAGVVAASFVGITLMVVVIQKTKRR